MKNTSKLIGILSALIVVILAVFLVTMFNSHESARVSTSSSPAKTVKKSSSSSSKGEGRGIGLSTVREILGKYPNCSLSTQSKDYRFKQTLKIEDVV